MQKWIRNLSMKQYLSTLKVGLKIDKSTKIASIGSCFARRIREYLLAYGYNYLLTEQDKNPWVKLDREFLPNAHGSAAWDRVFNTYTFSQIVATTFGVQRDRFYHTARGVADLMRTRLMYPDRKTAVEDVKDHIEQSAWVFKNADLLIVTLGLTEVWRFNSMVLPYLPEYIGRDKLQFARTTYGENLSNLALAWKTLKMENPHLKMLITLSPVHMNATFRDNIDVFSASCASKSILRAAIDAFVGSQYDVFYFPSYEIATIVCPELNVRQYEDGHHISEDAFGLITEAFETLFTNQPKGVPV